MLFGGKNPAPPVPLKLTGSQTTVTVLVTLNATPVTTVSVAVALLVMPADTPVTLAGELLYVPAALELTAATIVHVACPNTIAPPLKEMVLPPAVAVTVPLHCVATGTDATTTPRGSVSVNASPP